MFVLQNSQGQVWCKSGQGRTGMWAQPNTGPRTWTWKTAQSARSYRRLHNLLGKIVKQ